MENLNEQDRIPDPFEDEKVPAYLEERIINSLKSKGLISGSKIITSTFWLKMAASVFLIISLFFTGWWFGQKQDSGPQIATQNYNEYMLLTYNPTDFKEDTSHVAEYLVWFEKNSKEGYLELGRDLSEEGWTIDTDAARQIRSEHKRVTSTCGYVSGFFIIRAPTEEKAYEIACTCPHLKYKGIMELRAITF